MPASPADGQMGVEAAGGHVARVLLVARRIGDDELALGRGEIAVGDIDVDACSRSARSPSVSSAKSTVPAAWRSARSGREALVDRHRRP